MNKLLYDAPPSSKEKIGLSELPQIARPRQVYVLGFAFNNARTSVLLIQKARPAWQAGKLNGLGGKVEPGELPALAMAREFYEECGLGVFKEWERFAVMTSLDYDVHCYRAFLDDATFWSARATTDEPVSYHIVRALPESVLPNVRWLVPFALNYKSTEAIGGPTAPVKVCY
jgi:8-oxo-dGTP diphosphatase